MTKNIMDSAFWLKQGEENIFGPWFKHMLDESTGLFHLKYEENWQPQEEEGKIPWIISRHVFALAVGYMLYAKDEYLDKAKLAVDWLLEHAWDKEYGGWYDLVSPDGEVLDDNKTQFNYLYADTGLSMYYFVTGDKRVAEILEKSQQIRENYWWDKDKSGYFRGLNRDLSVRINIKDFGGQVVPISGPGLYRCVADPTNKKLLNHMQELLDIVFKYLVDDNGWVLEDFDPDWNYIGSKEAGKEVDIGHNIETAWACLRIYHLTGDERLIKPAEKFVNLCLENAFDETRGFWPYKVTRGGKVVHMETQWWVQEYGNFISLYMYEITGDDKYLEIFKKTADCWNQYFLDEENGGEFLTVGFDDSGVYQKRKPPTAYHSSEHTLLVALYLDLFVNKKPAELQFRISANEGDIHYVSPVEHGDVKLTGVKINGQTWDKFDSDQRSVVLPQGEDMKVEVILERR